MSRKTRHRIFIPFFAGQRAIIAPLPLRAARMNFRFPFMAGRSAVTGVGCDVYEKKLPQRWPLIVNRFPKKRRAVASCEGDQHRKQPVTTQSQRLNMTNGLIHAKNHER
jgi:hypothetical protein